MPESSPIRRTLHALVVLAPLVAVPVTAGDAPAGCDDLSGIPVTPGVDFARDVQPILDGCTGCHADGGAAGLDLRPGASYEQLVGVAATTNPGAVRVAPFEPDASVLLAAINCSDPGGPAFQMPGTVSAQRALVRDWIAQGALRRPAPRAVPVLGPVGAGVALLLVALAGIIALRRRAR